MRNITVTESYDEIITGKFEIFFEGICTNLKSFTFLKNGNKEKQHERVSFESHLRRIRVFRLRNGNKRSNTDVRF